MQFKILPWSERQGQRKNMALGEQEDRFGLAWQRNGCTPTPAVPHVTKYEGATTWALTVRRTSRRLASCF